jgi:hypothetical protein
MKFLHLINKVVRPVDPGSIGQKGTGSRIRNKDHEILYLIIKVVRPVE